MTRTKTVGLTLLSILAALPAHADTLTARWTDTMGGAASTRLERRLGSELAYTGLVTVAPGVSLYADASVLAGTMYCYRAQAMLGAEVSPYSNEDCASVSALSVLTLSLINAATGEPMLAYTPLVTGDVIDLATIGTVSLAVRAATLPATVGSVWFAYDGYVTIDNAPPYDQPNVIALGGHILGATPYQFADAQGAADTPLSVAFTIIDSTPPLTYTLTVSTQGPGTVTGPGIACPGDCAGSYSSGSTVVLTARKGKQGWIRFRGWSGACTGTALTCTVVMDTDKAVGASFGR